MLKLKTACLRLVISLKVTPIVWILMLCERSLNWTGGNAPEFSVDAERSSKRQCDIALLCVWNSPIFGLSRAELLRLRFNHTSSTKNCMRLLSRPEKIYPENLGAPRAQLPAWVMKVTNFWISPTTIVWWGRDKVQTPMPSYAVTMLLSFFSADWAPLLIDFPTADSGAAADGL